MAHRELYTELGSSLVKSLTPATRTSDTNGTGADLAGYDSALLVYHVGVSADSLSASVKLALEIEESDDDVTYTDVTSSTDYLGSSGWSSGVYTIDDDTEDDVIVAVAYKGKKRYVRPVLNFTGSHSSGWPTAVTIVRGHDLTI